MIKSSFYIINQSNKPNECKQKLNISINNLSNQVLQERFSKHFWVLEVTTQRPHIILKTPEHNWVHIGNWEILFAQRQDLWWAADQVKVFVKKWVFPSKLWSFSLVKADTGYCKRALESL